MSVRSRHDGNVLDATSLAADLSPLLPLRIHQVELGDGITLTVVGEGWSLNLMGHWTWRRGEVLVTDAEQPGAGDAVWDLCGVDLVAVRFPEPTFSGDCSYVLSDGSLVEVRSDRRGWESWTFHHDSLDTVYVGL